MYWMILNRETGQAWSNAQGWVSHDSESHDLFSDDEKARLSLPIEGEWRSTEPQGESPKPAQRWTAGPWETGDSRWPSCIVSQHGAPGALGLVRVAEVHYATSADLALMAAAPDLAEACQTALANLAPLYSSDHLVMVRLRAALRKAGAL